jgi:hypothetical protein
MSVQRLIAHPVMLFYNLSLSLSLLQDVLAEIPSQVVQYMDRQGIKPGIPEVDVVQKRLRSFAFRDE